MSDPRQVVADAERELERADVVVRRARRKKTDAPKTICPKCRSLKSRVGDPRWKLGEDGHAGTYWRIRTCQGCGATYSTEEITRDLLSD